MGWDDVMISKWIAILISKSTAQIILYGVSKGGATVMDVAPKISITSEGFIEDSIIECLGYFQYHIPSKSGKVKWLLHMAGRLK